MRWFIFAVAALHAAFMLGEMLPWSSPMLLQKLGAKRLKPLGTQDPTGKRWTPDQEKLVAAIVHNAGIYNAIIAGGLVWAAWPETLNRDVAQVLLAGAA